MPDSPSTIAQTAQEQKKIGNFNEAISILTKGVLEFPTDLSLRILLCHCHISKNNLTEAAIELNRAKEINPEDPRIFWNEARLLLRKKLISEALNIAKNANARFPNDIEGMAVLGSCLRAANDIASGLNYFNKVIEVSPNYADALINRGLIFASQNKKEKAVNDLKIAFNLQPYTHQIWDLLINLMLELKQFKEAIPILKDMIQRKPDRAIKHANLGLCHQYLAEFDAALDAYNEALELDPNLIIALNNSGIICKDQGKLEIALDFFNRALSVEPDFLDLRNNKAITLHALNRLEEAIEAHNKVLEIAPDNFSTYDSLGNIFRTQGKYREAISYYEKVNTQSAAAKLLECIYFTEDYDNFNSHLQLIAETDPINLRVAAISAFASHQLQQKDIYPFCTNPIELVKFSHIERHISNQRVFISDILQEMNERKAVWEPMNISTKGGFQTNSELLSRSSKNMKVLENIIKKELIDYKDEFNDEERLIFKDWPTDIEINAWYVRLLKSGHQEHHIHPRGWISGVFYLKTVASPIDDEGAIDFGIHGYKYPIVNDNYPRLRYQPKDGDLIFFPSSLFHGTIPVIKDVERCVIAFDLVGPR